MKPLCEGDPNRGPQLFGGKFGLKAKETADNIKALKGIKPAVLGRISFFSGYGRQRAPESLIQLGKKLNPNIFSRLGPQQSKNSQLSPHENVSNKQVKKSFPQD